MPSTEAQSFSYCLYHQDAVKAICNEVEALVKKCGKPKMFDAIKLPPPELYKYVEVCSLLSYFTFVFFNPKHFELLQTCDL